jgi:hypothetical protein
VKDTLDIWPLLPIVITVDNYRETWSTDNINMALELNDRIRELRFQRVTGSQLGNIFKLAAVQQPFPVLTHLELRALYHTWPEMTPVIPASFLGGSAPLLQSLWLDFILFPELPKLLMSATQLVDLRLWRIPHSRYISPEGIVTSLALLTSLKTLHIGFEFRDPSRLRPYQKSRCPFSSTRVLPVLTELMFKGANEYLEELVTQIDTPLLNNLHITLLDQPIFDTPQLMQFISRTPKFKAHNKACVDFSDVGASVILPQSFDGELELGISGLLSSRLLLSLAQLCRSSCCQTLIPAVEHLYIIKSKRSGLCWQGLIQSSQLLEFLHHFTALKDLRVSSEFAPHVSSALQKLVRESVTEVLPALQTIFLEETPTSGLVIGQFVAARRFANHPITISHWERSGMTLTSDYRHIIFMFGVIYYLLVTILTICVE